jgi:poly(hydroxyalkanoate) granule-associated protein
MARKTSSRSRYSGAAANDAGQSVTDSAQKIWLAGLGAFERAKAEGPKVFETLVEQGRSLGGKAREAADQAMRTVRDGAADAGGRFDKLEQVFEDRVQKSLSRLGVITRGEVGDLSQQVRDLTESVRDLMARSGRQAAGAAKPKRGGSQKRRAAAKAGATKRKVKRAASTVKRGAARRKPRARKG